MNYNFAFKDFIKSDVAKASGINNTPTDPAVIQNWFNLVVYCLQPVRDYIGKPMIESSGYRCAKLNTKVGGESTSHHLTGQALDFVVKGMSIEDAYRAIKKSGVKYTQLIQEKGMWLHISYVSGQLKCENLRYDGKHYIKDNG